MMLLVKWNFFFCIKLQFIVFYWFEFQFNFNCHCMWFVLRKMECSFEGRGLINGIFCSYARNKWKTHLKLNDKLYRLFNNTRISIKYKPNKNFNAILLFPFHFSKESLYNIRSNWNIQELKWQKKSQSIIEEKLIEFNYSITKSPWLLKNWTAISTELLEYSLHYISTFFLFSKVCLQFFNFQLSWIPIQEKWILIEKY
jgi:hypothetical protein